MADTSVAHTTDRGAHDEAQPVRGSLERPGPESDEPCTWCQHAEFIHAYEGPCLFSGCECPFFTPAAEPAS